MDSNYEQYIQEFMRSHGITERPKCPRCERPLGLVDGGWICFTPWRECGIMIEGHFDKKGKFFKVLK